MNHRILAGALLAGAAVLAFRCVEDDLAATGSAGPPPPAVAGVGLPRPADPPRGVAAASARGDPLPATPAGRAEPVPPAATPTAAAPPAVRVDGRWYGEIRGGPEEHLQFSFDFRTAGESLTGRAIFPVGEGRITDGRVQGNRLSFTTAHPLPQPGQVLLSRFEGVATEREILLDVDSGEGGLSRLTVFRIGR